MMKKLMDKVIALTDEELDMANEQYPLFASNHEGSAVIREEVEEADDEMTRIKYYNGLLWDDVKEDENVDDDVDEVEKHAIRCACECIQVAAMCRKIKIKK